MTRDIEAEKNRIRNGNRFITTDEGTGVFARDADTLFVQYKNLRWKVYRTYEKMLNNPNDKKDLKSYIDEQFIRLCKEYDINGAIDFAGYIKNMLNTRVHHVFIANHFRDKQREPLGATDDEVQVLYDTNVGPSTLDVEVIDLVQNVVAQQDVSNIQLELITHLINGSFDTDKKLCSYVAKKFQVSTRKVTKELLATRALFKNYFDIMSEK